MTRVNRPVQATSLLTQRSACLRWLSTKPHTQFAYFLDFHRQRFSISLRSSREYVKACEHILKF